MCNHPMTPCCEPPKRPCRYICFILPTWIRAPIILKADMICYAKMLWCNIFEITGHQIPCLLMPCPPGLGPIPELELELPSIPIPELLGIRIARSGIGIGMCNWNRIEDAISFLRFFNHTFDVHSTLQQRHHLKPIFNWTMAIFPDFSSFFYILAINTCPNNGEMVLLTD